MATEKIELILEDYTECYYYNDNNPYKIVFLKEDDTPIGLYDDEIKVVEFNGIDVICLNNLHLDDINKGNCDDYIFKKIKKCDCCNKSREVNFPNEYGICNCWCSQCSYILYRDCFCNE